MVFEILNKLWFLIVQSIVVVSASYYQKEYSGYLFTTFSYNSWEWRSQYDAQNSCNQNGSKLLAITNASIQTAAVAFINDARQQNQLTGNNIITDGRRTFGDWGWINKTDRISFSIGGQDSSTRSHGYLYTTAGYSLWADAPTDKSNYICEGQSLCGNGYQNQGQCFQSSVNEAVTWFEARNRCLMKGGDLATFEFITTNDGLNSLNGSWINPTSKYWIGLRRQLWTWQSIDSDVTYSQWGDGQPALFSNENVDCLCLGPNDWKWRTCRYTDSAQFVCIRASSSSGTVSSSTLPSFSTSNQRRSSPFNAVSMESVSVSSSTAQYSPAKASSEDHSTSMNGLAIGLGVGLGGGLLVTVLIIIIILLSRKGHDRKNDSENNVTSESPSTYESLKNGTRHDINNSAPTYQELNITE